MLAYLAMRQRLAERRQAKIECQCLTLKRALCGLAQAAMLPPLVSLRMLQWLAPFFTYHFLTGDPDDSIALAVAASLLVFLLAHVASAQGIVCAENIAGVETITLDYTMMPRAVYSHPQVASFGYTEAQAKEKGFDVKVGRFNFIANGKALGLGDYAGWVKIISDAKYGEILGAAMVGPDVSELLPELTLAQRMELTANEIARNVHSHPTLSEVLMEAAEAVEGHSIHQ